MYKDDPFYNDSGYPDPTAYHGIKEAVRDEQDLQRKAHNLVNVIKFITEWAGFELTGRITFRDRKTGKEFK